MKPLDLEEMFISTRGWVFQERLVSTATLYYTNEGKVWECAKGTSLGHNQNVSCVRWKTDWRDFIRRKTLNFSKSTTTDLSSANWGSAWHQWISAYSERNLYDNGDKFPAIAGVAKEIADVFRLPQGSYKAGLWKENFLPGLLWRRHNRTTTLTRLKGVAPAWSWASVVGRLEYRDVALKTSKYKGQNLEILEYSVREEFEGTYGCLHPDNEGNIRVKSILQEVTVACQNHPGE
jgi:hypothetical protein